MEQTDRYYDSLEIRDPIVRERALMEALPGQIAYAKAHSAYFGALLKDVEPAEINSRKALAELPVTRKADLIEIQSKNYPFGGLNATPPGRLARIFASPGPIYDLEGRRKDYWGFARALFAAGFRPGDIIHNSFSYHLTPAGAMIESGAQALECAVVPGGVGQTEQQLQAIAAIRPDGYCGTPSFLKILLEKARAEGVEISSLKKALVSGEAFLPSQRSEFKAFGITARQCYGTADVGLIAYESETEEGLIVTENIVVELVRPGTGEPVEKTGDVGEVVVTLLQPDYPLIRFATGDLSSELAGISPCGRTNMRLRGWLGRADQATKIRGMFVHPAQVNAVVKKHPMVSKARLVVDRIGDADEMFLEVEVSDPGSFSEAALLEDLRSATKLRGRIVVCRPGTLPADAKMIEDRRKLE
ncbi:MAG: AMP-binding protein [Acidobacteriia bacterium]|nr:AMP-binding protein [Methyloceanibacter sp.]MCL6491203.1 AMP-binding protein [Terriglobia bacterium]